MSRPARCSLIGLVTLFVLTARPAAAADLYTIDPAHCSVIFSVAHSGFSFTFGMFREASGTYALDTQNPNNSRFNFTIKTNSLDTNNPKRDEHLRSADIFNVQQYPNITFQTTECVATKIQDGGMLYQLKGDLTIHGVTRQVAVPLRMLGEGQGPYKDHRTGFITQIELKRTEYGMNEWLQDNLVGDAVGVTISFEGVRQDAAAGARPQ